MHSTDVSFFSPARWRDGRIGVTMKGADPEGLTDPYGQFQWLDTQLSAVEASGPLVPPLFQAPPQVFRLARYCVCIPPSYKPSPECTSLPYVPFGKTMDRVAGAQQTILFLSPKI